MANRPTNPVTVAAGRCDLTLERGTRHQPSRACIAEAASGAPLQCAPSSFLEMPRSESGGVADVLNLRYIGPTSPAVLRTIDRSHVPDNAEAPASGSHSRITVMVGRTW